MSAVYVELSARGLSEGESGGKAPRCASRASALPARQPIEGEERSITDRVTLSMEQLRISSARNASWFTSYMASLA